jgi:hypothetical protein
MEGPPRLDETLVQVFSQPQHGVDLRHLQTLAWMMGGRMPSGTISLTAWLPSGPGRAVYAPSPGRRVARGRENARLAVPVRYGPRLPQALAEWGHQLRELALDPSTLGKTSWLVRRSIVYRGRAVPSVWQGLEHPSRRVASAVDTEVLAKVVAWRPFRGRVVCGADRGCADPHLLAHLAR